MRRVCQSTMGGGSLSQGHCHVFKTTVDRGQRVLDHVAGSTESVGPILKHKPVIMVRTSNPSAQEVVA